MQLHIIEAGYLKLDGGAMFGVVPKVLWQKTNPADENNLCTWAMRCLLLEDDHQLILIDTGIGDKQDEKFLHRYQVQPPDLIHSIHQAGFSAEDITDVFLTHLHFDHCGGAVKFLDPAHKVFEMTFPQANYWSNPAHWQWATQPNAREKGSFLKENIIPIQESGQLKMVDLDQPSPFPQFDIMFVDGHTEKQMIPRIKYKGKTIIYAADILPSVGHIPLPYVMSYDTRPLLTLEEKGAFLKEVADREYIVFFEHDPRHQCCTLQHTDKGVRLKETFDLKEIL